jgi:hypothetical protein
MPSRSRKVSIRSRAAVSKDGAEHLDDQGCRCAIDFHTFRVNLRKMFKMPEEWWTENLNYIGFRDIVAKPPHITAATDPPTRFVFPMPERSANFLHTDFHQFQVRLWEEAGVSTLDMS